MQADKNLGFVILDESIYTREVNRHIQDNNTYTILTKREVESKQTIYLSFQKALVKRYKENLPDYVDKFMDIASKLTIDISKFKVLVKMHKLVSFDNLDKLRFRAIIANHSSFTMPLSRVLDALLQLEHKHILKDTQLSTRPGYIEDTTRVCICLYGL